jgi:hypothetical protein
MMKKNLTILLSLTFLLSYGQSNDDLRSGAAKKKSSSSSSGGGSSSSGSSGGGVSSGDLGLLIDACGCLINVAYPFFTEVVIKGIQKNTAYVRENKDSLPRIRNVEFSIGYGAFGVPDSSNIIIPKIRLQSGYIGTSARAYIKQDKYNPFSSDLLVYYDWQMLEINYIRTQHFTMRSGVGLAAFFNTSSPQNRIINFEVGTSGDLFFGEEDKFRANVELRTTFKGRSDLNFRSEALARFYVRPSAGHKFRPELFVGGHYSKYFSEYEIYKLELGAGFMIY